LPDRKTPALGVAAAATFMKRGSAADSKQLQTAAPGDPAAFAQDDDWS